MCKPYGLPSARVTVLAKTMSWTPRLLSKSSCKFADPQARGAFEPDLRCHQGRAQTLCCGVGGRRDRRVRIPGPKGGP